MDDSVAAVFGGLGILWLALIVFFVVVYWKIFTKAGKPGWMAIIPIVNLYGMIKIAKLPGWLIFLYLIPVVNVIVSLVVIIKLCEAFGKSVLFGVLTIFFGIITLPILAFGSSEYIED